MNSVKNINVTVIGSGQAGLAAGYYLQKYGLKPHRDFLILDANTKPGGAWQHRWPALRVDKAHNIENLPGLARDLTSSQQGGPASKVMQKYFAEYENKFGFGVIRPFKVRRVTNYDPSDADAGLLIEGEHPGGILQLRTSIVINATGTWNAPFIPYYPGHFSGHQLHVRNYRHATDYIGQRVLVVGGGTSAVQLLIQLADAGAHTLWSTRRPVDFTTRNFDYEWGVEVETAVRKTTRQGLPTQSVVSQTGLPLTDEYARARAAGILVSQGKIHRFEGKTVVLDAGEYEIDTIMWATGFRGDLKHLAPLRLRTQAGGIITDGVNIPAEKRILLAGYGYGASMSGAKRSGKRAAALAVSRLPRLLSGNS